MILSYGVIVLIFVLILTPMSIYRIEVLGNEGIISRVFLSAAIATNVATSNNDSGIFGFITSTLEIYFKYLGWILIPSFLIFVPIGTILVLKKRNFQKNTIIVTFILMSISSLYAYSIPILDHRYLYFLFPMISVVSVLGIRYLLKNYTRQNIGIIIIILAILVSSLIFTENKKFDYEHENEAFNIAKEIYLMGITVNEFSTESNYLKVAAMPDSWPKLSSTIESNTKIIAISNFETLDQFLQNAKDLELTHIAIDEKEDNPKYFNHIFKK